MNDNDDNIPGGVRTESLALQAYWHFRRQLMTGRYKPGQKIKLKEMSEQLGISATPIREALGRLVSEKALFQVDRRSVRVPVIDAERYKHIRDIRILLEGEGAERAALRAEPEEIARLEALHEQLCSAHETGDDATLMEANENFHRMLCSMAHMPVLLHMVENLWLQCGPIMNAFAGHPQRAPRERHAHLGVIHGLRERDPDLARRSIQTDIAHSSERILSYLAGEAERASAEREARDQSE